jgi:hypothetical protein
MSTGFVPSSVSTVCVTRQPWAVAKSKYLCLGWQTSARFWYPHTVTDEAKALYKERAATAECVNAQARNRGLVLLPVRGLKKVKAVALLFALAHNLMCTLRLAPELIGIGTGTSGIPGMAV